MHRVRRVLRLVAAVVTIAAIAAGCSRDEAEEPLASPPAPPVPSIGADELFTAFDTDPEAAEQYRGKTLDVYGIVRVKLFDETQSGVALLVEDPLDRKPRVACTICGTLVDGRRYGSFQDFERLVPGQKVVIRGECRGIEGFGGYYVRLDSCKVMHVEPAPTAVTTEIDGRWIAQSIVYDGKPHQWVVATTWDIRGNEIFVNDTRLEWGFGDTMREVPDVYDAWFTVAEDGNRKLFMFEAETARDTFINAYGIYQLDGDTLTVCYSDSKERMPTQLESAPESRLTQIVFTRAKE